MARRPEFGRRPHLNHRLLFPAGTGQDRTHVQGSFVVFALALVVGLMGSPPVPLHAAGDARTAQPVVYDVSFPNAVHDEARVAVTFRGLTAGKPLEILMSRASPGRYLHEFAKNVYGVSAADGRGRPLAVTHPTPVGRSGLRRRHPGPVSVRCKLFTRRAW